MRPYAHAEMHPVTRRIIDRSPERLRPGAILVFRTVDDSVHDRVPGLAAEIAFYSLLSLLPLLLTILGTVGFVADAVGGTFALEAVDRIADLLGNVFAAATIEDTIRPLLEELLERGRGDVATFGFLLTMFSASRALRVVATAITIAYDLEETRKGWSQRIWGLGLTFAGIILALLLVPLLVAGPGFGEVLARNAPVDPGIAEAWQILYWPFAGVVASAIVATLYHFAAPWWTPWHRDLPGAVLAVLLFLGGTVGLRVYASASFEEGTIYAQFATPLVVLLWFWVSSIALLVGAEFNAELERLWPTTTARAEHEGISVAELQRREMARRRERLSTMLPRGWWARTERRGAGPTPDDAPRRRATDAPGDGPAPQGPPHAVEGGAGQPRSEEPTFP